MVSSKDWKIGCLTKKENDRSIGVDRKINPILTSRNSIFTRFNLRKNR